MAENIPCVLNKIINGYCQKNWQLKLMHDWQTIFGTMAQQALLEKVDHDTITVGVFDSSWMQELYLLSPLLLEKINRTLEGRVIKHIRFKKIPKTVLSPYKKMVPIKKSKEVKSVLLNDVAKRALGRVHDDDLKKTLQQLYVLVCDAP